MSDIAHVFESGRDRVAVFLPFDLSELVADWTLIQRLMVREPHREFTRDEWAYLVRFLDEENARSPFYRFFGTPAGSLSGPPDRLVRPRGSVSVWLPNNASLLGPLTLFLLSLTGNHIRLKAGSRSDDLTTLFHQYVIERSRGAVARFLTERVTIERFSRDDPRNAQMAASADVRMAFGSDQAMDSIERLPHPADSSGFYFSDRHSEAWLMNERLDETTLHTLIRVFSIYGQAGCTSPHRIVLLGGSVQEARALRDRLAELWPRVITAEAPLHVASGNIMAVQWARALGWDAVAVTGNRAVLATGEPGLERFESLMALPIIGASLEEAFVSLPENIQTVGHALSNRELGLVVPRLARSRIKRFVPIAKMHHFGPVWDGREFWRDCFEEMALEV